MGYRFDIWTAFEHQKIELKNTACKEQLID